MLGFFLPLSFPSFTSLAPPFTSTNHFHLLLAAAAFLKIFLFSTITWSNIRKSPYLTGFVIFRELVDRMYLILSMGFVLVDLRFQKNLRLGVFILDFI